MSIKKTSDFFIDDMDVRNDETARKFNESVQLREPFKLYTASEYHEKLKQEKKC